MNRIVGLETEYGCLLSEAGAPAGLIGRVRNWLFEGNRFGLPDLHQRDWDEPAGNGGFLYNGGRAYVDMGHMEYCTPECLTVRDVIKYDRAGDALLNLALKELELNEVAGFVRNNVDHYSGATFGCHENYLVRRQAPLNEKNVMSLLAFLTVRMVMVGAGKVGTSPGVELGNAPFLTGKVPKFQISQRADYINNDLFEWVQFNRAIINTRDEPLADGRKYRRLHLLHGDTSVLPATLALKVGTTSLVLDLLEIDHLPEIALADAVMTFHLLSHDLDGPWLVHLSDGRQMDALELLDLFRRKAQSEFGGRDEETDNVLRLWQSTIERLCKKREELVGVVDWVTKRWLFEQFIAEQNLDWDDPWLKSLDLEFHHISPGRSLALPLDKPEQGWTPAPEEVIQAMLVAPGNTRAGLRSRLMTELSHRNLRYYVDWEVLDAAGAKTLELSNPFEASDKVAAEWLKSLEAPDDTPSSGLPS
jgi:proteasome accessory factor A